MHKGKYFDPFHYCLILSIMALRSQKLEIQYLKFLEYSCTSLISRWNGKCTFIWKDCWETVLFFVSLGQVTCFCLCLWFRSDLKHMVGKWELWPHSWRHLSVVALDPRTPASIHSFLYNPLKAAVIPVTCAPLSATPPFQSKFPVICFDTALY